MPADRKPYRFGFVLTTAIGNKRRYLNLRKYVERDPEVESVWAPINYELDPGPVLRRMPAPIRVRATVFREASPVLGQMGRLDAVMFHIFEPYLLSVARNLLFPRPLLVWSQDLPPNSGSPDFPVYPELAREEWRRRLRFKAEVACARRVELFFPFSHWAAQELIEACAVHPEKVHPIHVGLDLAEWPYVPQEPTSAKALPRILFVGGDFDRKGGDLLLDLYREKFSDSAELHVVTKQAPAGPPQPNVQVHTDIGPEDPRLRKLYAESDVFVLPTRADLSPWVVLEAMATGRPVISTRTTGLPDMVRDGETGFLLAVDDRAALAARLQQLLDDPSLRHRMGQAARSVVERQFDAAVCVARILSIMKEAVDRGAGRRAGVRRSA